MALSNGMPTNAITPIELFADAGLLPADSDGFPDWFAGRYDAAAICGDGSDYVVAGHNPDDEVVTLTNIDRHGVIYATLRFNAPEDAVHKHEAAAFTAVVRAWLTL